MKRQWIISKQDHQSRIDDFLFRQGISKKALKSIKMKGEILVDYQHRTVRYLLNAGETLMIHYPPEENTMQPYDFPLKIVYEDDYLLVIDKPSGLPSIPTRTHPFCTLANALTFYYQQIGLTLTIHLVNRLDKETSGLMIVAKYRYIHDRMMKDLKHIDRRYRAHVRGIVTSDGSIRLPIYKQDKQMKRMIDERGKEACTHYHVRRIENGCSLVEMKLETGRTHQIRVHMASIGHPLIGDSLYGDGLGYFDLDSYQVGFIHPVTKQCIVIIKKAAHDE